MFTTPGARTVTADQASRSGIHQLMSLPPGPVRVVVVTGPRSWVDGPALSQQLGRLPLDTVVILGGAAGADTLAQQACQHLSLRHLVVTPLWQRYGRSAGHRRNAAMLSLGPIGLLACIPAAGLSRGRTPGTLHCVTTARALHIPVWAVHPSSSPPELSRPAIARPPVPAQADYISATPGDYLATDWADDGYHPDLSVCTFGELVEPVEIREADFSVKQLNWQHLPAWELLPQTRYEDPFPMPDRPRSTQPGRDLGAKPAPEAATAWEITVDSALQTDARLEALAIRQLEFSLKKAFNDPQPAPPALPLPQIRGHVRVGPPATA